MAYSPARTIYVKAPNHRRWSIFTNVTSTQEGWRYVPDGLYRDEGWDASGDAAMVSSGTGTSTANIPVIGIPGQTPVYNSWSTLQHSAPDNQTHTPPRQRYVWKNGLYIQNGANAIPDPPDPAFQSVTFSAATTDILTAAHTFVSGDRVTSSIATGGFSTTMIYTVIKISSTEIKLLTSAGAILDVSSAVSPVITLVSTVVAPEHLPEGVFFVPEYQYSDTDPR